MSLTEFDQEAYDRHRFNDGKEVGIAEGKKVGVAIGIAEGKRDNALQNARNLLIMNILSIEQIPQATQLSVDEVLQLQEEMTVEVGANR